MSCGCTTRPCGCCAGVQVSTPQPVANRPGLAALRYRVGTHASFMQSMRARLSTMAVDGLGADGQPLAGLRPLQRLTTREADDPAIALLDAWATLGDVLTFYQERIANEAFLGTAIERRSVLELARLVGYTPRPGVAASTYLAYTLDANQAAPVTLASGARSQSVPDPDETAQTFETGDDLLARRAWNNLQVRLQQPLNITLDNVLTIATLQVAGSATALKPGDPLLLVFSDDGRTSALRVVEKIDTRFADQRTVITLRAIAPELLRKTGLLLALVADATRLLATDPRAAGVIAATEQLLAEVYLGAPLDTGNWGVRLVRIGAGASAELHGLLAALAKAFGETVPGGAPARPVTSPAAFASALLKPPIAQVRNSLQLPRSLSQSFLPPGSAISAALQQPLGGMRMRAAADKAIAHATLGATSAARAASATSASVISAGLRAPVYADVGTQLLVQFAPQLQRSYYAAWAGAALNPAPAALQGVFVLRARATLFGANAAKLPSYDDAHILNPQNLWPDWTYGDAPDETADNAFLDQANENIAPGGYVLVERSGRRDVLRVARATTGPRTAYGLSGPTTQLSFDPPAGAGAGDGDGDGEGDSDSDSGWRSVDPKSAISELRRTQLLVQSDPLSLLDAPIDTVVSGASVTLDGLYDGLTSGRWVIFAGERADIDQVDGVQVAELQMISGLSHSFDANLPGDTVHTTLLLATPLAYSYRRATLTIYANVVRATHGQTRIEVLGNGDGAQALQSFTLKQPPLTFVAAPTPAGAQSTLQLRVNEVLWHEAASLASLGPRDRGFVTLTDDAGATSVWFGDGSHGARPPSGVQNVVAQYRNGIGSVGNVKAGQITLLQTKPLGVKQVVNPLRASGGADKEDRDLARQNAPLSVLALDRLVSVADYADFTRRFAGIAKVVALQVSDGQRQLVYLTIAGVDDSPIDPGSDLCLNLIEALREAGDADLPLRVDLRDLKALVLSANIKLLPDFAWEPVAIALRAQLLAGFGFAARALGQPALLCEVIAAMQNVRGVAYVDVDAFGAVPQTVAVGGVRQLVTQDDVADAIRAIVQPAKPAGGRSADRLPANLSAWPGGVDAGALRPAELLIFVAGVADTLVLNQIP